MFKSSNGAKKVSSNPSDYGSKSDTMATIYNNAKRTSEYVIQRNKFKVNTEHQGFLGQKSFYNSKNFTKDVENFSIKLGNGFKIPIAMNNLNKTQKDALLTNFQSDLKLTKKTKAMKASEAFYRARTESTFNLVTDVKGTKITVPISLKGISMQDRAYLFKNYQSTIKLRKKTKADAKSYTVADLPVTIEMRDGSKERVPSLIPTLTEKQAEYLLKGRKPTTSILKKIKDFAEKRKALKLPFFADNQKGDFAGKKSRDSYKWDKDISYQKGTGNIDRGHLADFGSTSTSMDAENSFTRENVLPMKSTFNRGSWKAIESEFKEITQKAPGETYVVTGAIKNDWLTPSLANKKGERFEVPRRFYKAIWYGPGKVKAYIGMNNAGGSTKEISIKELSKISGYEFFSDLN